jgi:hypothetical protein
MDINKKMYIVKSTRQGVEEPKEREVVSISEKVGQYTSGSRKDKYIDLYKLDTTEFPYEVDLVEDEISGEDEGYGTGVGDLWAWTYYYTKSLEDAWEYHKRQSEWVKEQYLKEE